MERGGFTLDHVRPVADGGARLDPRNLVTSCMTCNQHKGQARPLSRDAARRARNAVRRLVPDKRVGRKLFKESRGKLGVARAAFVRDLLDPSSVLYFRPELPLAEEPDDFIPW